MLNLKQNVYNYFFIVLSNTETNKKTCYSFLVNNNLKIALVGKRDINTTQFITSDGTSVLWHELEGSKHIIKQLTSTLQIIKYDIGEDYKSIQPIHFCQKCFRVIRTSGRVDLYSSSPAQSSRIASYFERQADQQLFSVYNYVTGRIYIEYSNKSTITPLNASSMFYSRFISARPIDLCQKSILQPIFASPQRVYSIFISVIQNENKQQQIKLIRTYYEPYYGYYYDNSSYITLAYNATIDFTIVSYRYFQKQNTLVACLTPSYDPSRRVLTGIKIDFLQLINDFMVWDWLLQLSPSSKITSYELDQSSLVVMQQNGRMIRYQPNGVGIKKTPEGVSGQKLPFLISKSGNIVAYYGYYSGFTDKTIFADSVTGETLYLMNSYNFIAISPSGLLLAEKSQLNANELNIYKKVNLLGRIKLPKAISKNSKVWFMAEDIILQIQISGSRVELYLFNFKEDPFIYTSYSFTSNEGTNNNLVSFSEVNVAVGLVSRILVLDRKLNTVQTLSTSFIENGAPQSVSMAEGGNVYAKLNNMLYIWKNGQCPDGLSNKDGICDKGGSGDVSTGQLAGIIGGSAGGAVLVAASVLLIRRWKKRKQLSLLESQGVNAND